MFRNLLYKTFAHLGASEAQAFEKSTLSPRDTQAKVLSDIVESNADSRFGREHNFSQIKTIADYQKALPIRDYDAFSPYINRLALGEKRILTTQEPFMFATTSGTSGARKLIPITDSYMKEFRRASVVSGFNLLKNFPKIANGVILSVASPAEEGRTEGGIPFGAISGRLFLSESKLMRKFISPIPYEVFLIKEYEARYYTLLRCVLTLPLATIYTLNPSTILLLAQRLRVYGESLVKDLRDGIITPPSSIPESARDAIRGFLRPDPVRARFLQQLLDKDEFLPHKIWPTLAVVSCWTKAAASFYLQDFPQYFGDVPICDITYGASEGRGTVCLKPNEQVLALRSHFFEFVPADEMENANSNPNHYPRAPHALLSDELTVGKEYYILFTTSGGLYRYNINDIVKVVGHHNQAPVLEFLHKGGNICSFTGEKITESQVTQAMYNVGKKLNLNIRFFTVIPQFRPQPHYEVWIEVTNGGSLNQLPEISRSFDDELRALNIEYDTKRESLRLDNVVVRQLRHGTYEKLRKLLTSQGIPDAQIKISHLNPKSDVTALLEQELLQQRTESVLSQAQ